MSMAMVIGAIYCGELQRQTERRIREELEAESMRKMAEKAFGPVSGSDSVPSTLDGYDDFIRSRLTPLP